VIDLNPVLDLFSTRKTKRKYRREPLADGDLEKILDAGQRAPTGASGQLYSVIRITDPDLREGLRAIAGGQSQIRDAAEFLVFCIDLYRAEALITQRGGSFDPGPRVAVHYATMDTMLLAANVATAAEALGYGTCYIGGVLNQTEVVADMLNLPAGVVPIVGLVIGVPEGDGASSPTPRLPGRLVYHENAYQTLDEADVESAFQAMGERWGNTLERFFGPDGRLAAREGPWVRALAQQALDK
jgi:nitroreductase